MESPHLVFAVFTAFAFSLQNLVMLAYMGSLSIVANPSCQRDPEESGLEGPFAARSSPKTSFFQTTGVPRLV